MKIRPVGAELFDAKRRAERQTDRRTNGRSDTQTDVSTDRYYKSDGRFSHFCERAYLLRIIYLSGHKFIQNNGHMHSTDQCMNMSQLTEETLVDQQKEGKINIHQSGTNLPWFIPPCLS